MHMPNPGVVAMEDPLFYDPFPKIEPRTNDPAELPKIKDHKPTNPKDAVGCKKAPLHLIPTTAKPEVALAFLEGALKYGTANWRKDGVKASIYKSALERHLDKWWEGEDRDQLTQVEHLASIIACASIILDARLAGKLADDRPIVCGEEGRAREAMDDITDRVQRLHQIFEVVQLDQTGPHHFTRDNEEYYAQTHGVWGLTESER